MMEIGERTAALAVDMGFWLPSGFLDDGQFPGGEETSCWAATFGGDKFSPAAEVAKDEVARRKAWPFSGAKSPPRSPNCTSPPVPPAAADAFGLLYAGAGEIAVTRSPSPTSSFPRSGYYPSHPSTLQHIQRLREKGLIKQQFAAAAAAWVMRERAIRGGVFATNIAAAVLPPPAWIPLKRHQQIPQIGVPGSGGARTSFFDDDGGFGRKVSAGTGVFLPRSAASEHHLKKSVTTTTTSAAQSLAINPRFSGEINVGVSVAPPSKILIPISVAAAAAAAEIRLPPEWTY